MCVCVCARAPPPSPPQRVPGAQSFDALNLHLPGHGGTEPGKRPWRDRAWQANSGKQDRPGTFLSINRAEEQSSNLPAAPQWHDAAPTRHNFSRQSTTSDLAQRIYQRVPNNEVADGIMQKLETNGIISINDLELIRRSMFEARGWSESEINIVLLDDQAWSENSAAGASWVNDFISRNLSSRSAELHKDFRECVQRVGIQSEAELFEKYRSIPLPLLVEGIIHRLKERSLTAASACGQEGDGGGGGRGATSTPDAGGATSSSPVRLPCHANPDRSVYSPGLSLDVAKGDDDTVMQSAVAPSAKRFDAPHEAARSIPPPSPPPDSIADDAAGQKRRAGEEGAAAGTPPEKRQGNVAAGPMEKKASSSPAAAAAAR